MLKAKFAKYTLDFTFEARTSRGSLWHKPTYLVCIWDDQNPSIRGVGECNLFPGLSAEDKPDFEQSLREACQNVEEYRWDISSINFGLETALADLRNGGTMHPYPSKWDTEEEGITINGLVWMGDKELMLHRVQDKLENGFRCIKLKIGGINFEDELEILKGIRSRFSKDDLEIRLDANGAFDPSVALSKLKQLSKYGIHSIEQPIKAGQWQEMRRICQDSSIPIALDEELIGMHTIAEKRALLNEIMPRYIILKPALCGGLREADQWINEAELRGIGWWATSALESNIGLNAIAQWVSQKLPQMPQGLGTGSLYSNNFPSPVSVEGNKLYHRNANKWDLEAIDWEG